ncbi:hypothetical protein K438DRAFT_1990451 [Mycena galopus ATCC 62051]|nr:hypothetical protein K438DRAFT_1990451 [Mycena galopus ATCC 62051]
MPVGVVLTIRSLQCYNVDVASASIFPMTTTTRFRARASKPPRALSFFVEPSLPQELETCSRERRSYVTRARKSLRTHQTWRGASTRAAPGIAMWARAIRSTTLTHDANWDCGVPARTSSHISSLENYRRRLTDGRHGAEASLYRASTLPLDSENPRPCACLRLHLPAPPSSRSCHPTLDVSSPRKPSGFPRPSRCWCTCYEAVLTLSGASCPRLASPPCEPLAHLRGCTTLREPQRCRQLAAATERLERTRVFFALSCEDASSAGRDGLMQRGASGTFHGYAMLPVARRSSMWLSLLIAMFTSSVIRTNASAHSCSLLGISASTGDSDLVTYNVEHIHNDDFYPMSLAKPLLNIFPRIEDRKHAVGLELQVHLVYHLSLRLASSLILLLWHPYRTDLTMVLPRLLRRSEMIEDVERSLCRDSSSKSKFRLPSSNAANTYPVVGRAHTTARAPGITVPPRLLKRLEQRQGRWWTSSAAYAAHCLSHFSPEN